MLWTFNPDRIAAKFVSDWQRLVKHPFQKYQVGRETNNTKGRLAAIDLRSTQSLRAAFGQEHFAWHRRQHRHHTKKSWKPRFQRGDSSALTFSHDSLEKTETGNIFTPFFTAR